MAIHSLLTVTRSHRFRTCFPFNPHLCNERRRHRLLALFNFESVNHYTTDIPVVKQKICTIRMASFYIFLQHDIISVRLVLIIFRKILVRFLCARCSNTHHNLLVAVGEVSLLSKVSFWKHRFFCNFSYKVLVLLIPVSYTHLLQRAAQRRGARGVQDRQQLPDGAHDAPPQERDGLQTGAGVYCRSAGFERGLDCGQHDFVKTVHTIKTADQLLCTFPMDFI